MADIKGNMAKGLASAPLMPPSTDRKEVPPVKGNRFDSLFTVVSVKGNSRPRPNTYGDGENKTENTRIAEAVIEAGKDSGLYFTVSIFRRKALGGESAGKTRYVASMPSRKQGGAQGINVPIFSTDSEDCQTDLDRWLTETVVRGAFGEWRRKKGINPTVALAQNDHGVSEEDFTE
jgi:hypothetical protein